MSEVVQQLKGMKKRLKPTLVLDAMGVMYRAGDDVAELLIPFLKARGASDEGEIERLYMEASLAKCSSANLWEAFNLDPSVEDEFLDGYELIPGLKAFLEQAQPFVAGVWCLSNDVPEWSKKLKRKFDLDRYFDGFVISGDVGARKPDRVIFDELLKQSGTAAKDAIFVDDRLKNLDAAAELGFRTILFDTTESSNATTHRCAKSFHDLWSVVREYESRTG